MIVWTHKITFRVFIKANGRDDFGDWLESQGADAEEKIRGLIKRMSNLMVWDRPFFGDIHGKKHREIKEIIIKGNKQYRVLGCCGPGPQIFTILIGATKESNHKKTTWTPPNALNIAEKRCKLVFENKEMYSDVYTTGKRSTKETTT